MVCSRDIMHIYQDTLTRTQQRLSLLTFLGAFSTQTSPLTISSQRHVNLPGSGLGEAVPVDPSSTPRKAPTPTSPVSLWIPDRMPTFPHMLEHPQGPVCAYFILLALSRLFSLCSLDCPVDQAGLTLRSTCLCLLPECWD